MAPSFPRVRPICMWGNGESGRDSDSFDSPGTTFITDGGKNKPMANLCSLLLLRDYKGKLLYVGKKLAISVLGTFSPLPLSATAAHVCELCVLPATLKKHLWQQKERLLSCLG